MADQQQPTQPKLDLNFPFGAQPDISKVERKDIHVKFRINTFHDA